ncbi:MAG: ribosome silencing factor [Candidatus Margulisiibacteriota bacterium]|nr:ribosome silencing factor [Candidatus Margulisiibacteriota bacterium]
MNIIDEEKLVEKITDAADDKKALDIKVLKLGNISRIADFLVICSGESSVQLEAIASHIEDKLQKGSGRKCSREGAAKSGWLILDAGSIVIHVMSPEQRDYYDLEGLWGKDAVIFHY